MKSFAVFLWVCGGLALSALLEERHLSEGGAPFSARRRAVIVVASPAMYLVMLWSTIRAWWQDLHGGDPDGFV